MSVYTSVRMWCLLHFNFAFIDPPRLQLTSGRVHVSIDAAYHVLFVEGFKLNDGSMVALNQLNCGR